MLRAGLSTAVRFRRPKRTSRLVRFGRLNRTNVLKPALNTEPKVYYAQLDGEVR